MLASARDLLSGLGALDAGGRITAHGRELARVAVHPRLAHMLLRARALGALPLAANLAALLSERDLLRGAAGGRDADVRTRLEVMHGEDTAAGVDRVRAAAQPPRGARSRAATGTAAPRCSATPLRPAAPVCCSPSPIRIASAARREAGEGRFTLANGRGA